MENLRSESALVEGVPSLGTDGLKDLWDQESRFR